MAKLNTTVHVDGVAYGPGKDIPSAIAAQISNPDVWEGGRAPSAAGSAVKPQATLLDTIRGTQPAAAATPAAPAALVAQASDIPPKGGAGSGKDAWLAYADGKSDGDGNPVEIPADANRDDIVALLDAAGVPTEQPE